MHTGLLQNSWTFCIIAHEGDKQQIMSTINSITNLNPGKHEVIIFGKNLNFLPDKIKAHPFEIVPKIAPLKCLPSLCIEEAVNENLVICCEGIIFHEDFITGIESFDNNWEILCCRILNPDGTRYWDWAVKDIAQEKRLLEYDDSHKNTLLPDKLCVVKTKLAKEAIKKAVNKFKHKTLDLEGCLKSQGLKLTCNPYSTTTQKNSNYTQINDKVLYTKPGDHSNLGNLPIRWLGPVFNPSGYASEGRDFLLSLNKRLKVGLKHNNTIYSKKFVKGLDGNTAMQLLGMAKSFNEIKNGIVINHNTPEGFERPLDADYVIGRTMFETDRIPNHWVTKCLQMDEIWVPSHFNYETFKNSGVDESKLHVIPGSVDTDHYDPVIHSPLNLKNKKGFNFLAIFEWSSRKAWDVLINAYFGEFSSLDDVCLHIRSYGFGKPDMDASSYMWAKIKELAYNLKIAVNELPKISIIEEQIPTQDFPRLYKSVDCLVGVSRGEGWGRPMHEAMSMALPVIGTNWGGNTEYMTHENSVLVDYSLKEITIVEPHLWYYRGHKWAEPCVKSLQKSMRGLFENPAKSKAIGKKARSHIVRHFSKKVVGDLILNRLSKINSKINNYTLKSVESILPPYSKNTNAKHHLKENIRVGWQGPINNCSSFGRVNLNMCQNLKKFINLDVLDGTNNSKDVPALVANHSILSTSTISDQFRDLTVNFEWPPKWLKQTSKGQICYQPWEYGSIPKSWVAPLKLASQIWTPTEYVKNSFIAAGIDKNDVHVLPHGYDPEIYNTNVTPLRLKTKKAFKFLFVGGTIYRKGFDILLKAFLETFTKDDDVALIIKDFGNNTYYKGWTSDTEIEKALNRTDSPELIYIRDELTEKNMASLYRACDCLVQPYRGEGFCLPVLEAMACGLTSIVTSGGATDDFAYEPYVWRIPSRKIKIGNRVSNTELENVGWLLEPCFENLKLLLQRAFQFPELTSEKGKNAGLYAKCYWTWEKSAAKALFLLNKAIDTTKDKPLEQLNIATSGIVSKATDITDKYDKANLRDFNESNNVSFLSKKEFQYSVCTINYSKTISAIVLKRNSAKTISRCIKSLLEFVDEIIVVDLETTGVSNFKFNDSKVRVLSCSEIDSISKARNKGLSNSKSAWVLFVEPNEQLYCRDLTKFLGQLSRKDVLAYYIPFSNVKCPSVKSLKLRLFRNQQGLEFEGEGKSICHRSLNELSRRSDLKVLKGTGSIGIMAHPKPLLEEALYKDFEFDALQRQLNSDPDDVFALVGIGNNLFEVGHVSLAYEYYNKAFSIILRDSSYSTNPELLEDIPTRMALALIQSRSYDKALFLLTSTFLDNHNRTASQEFLLGLAYYNKGSFHQAFKAFKKYLEKKNNWCFSNPLKTICLGQPELYLALTAIKLEMSSIETYIANAINSASEPDLIRANIIDELCRSNMFTGAFKLLIAVSKGDLIDTAVLKRAVGNILSQSKDLKLARKWNEESSRLHPTDLDIQKQRAGLLLLAGQHSKAEMYFRSLYRGNDPEVLAGLIICSLFTSCSNYDVGSDDNLVAQSIQRWLVDIRRYNNRISDADIKNVLKHLKAKYPYLCSQITLQTVT